MRSVPPRGSGWVVVWKDANWKSPIGNSRRGLGKVLLIKVNGEPREVREGISLPELIADLSLKAEKVAVELNHSVIRRAEWESTVLQPDDKVEIVHFVGGGCKAN